MTIIVRNTYCCGLREIHGIRETSPADTIKTVNRLRNRPTFLIFTDYVDDGNNSSGHRLANYIIDNKFGAIVVTEPSTNRNSGRLIQVWTWRPDYAAIWFFCVKGKSNA